LVGRNLKTGAKICFFVKKHICYYNCGGTKNSNIQFLFEEKPEIMKNTHFAPVLHVFRARGSRHSERICIFFC